jgi:type I restriction enzyme M protein
MLAVPKATKKTVLATLNKKRLIGLARDHELGIPAHSSKEQFIEALAGQRKLGLEALLDALNLAELKAACVAHELDDGGRAKADLIARLLGQDQLSLALPAKPDLTPKPASPPAPPRMTTLEPTPAPPKQFSGFSEITSFLWQVADRLRGSYKQADYGKVILPFTVLRRLDCVLRPTKQKVLDRHEALKGGTVKNLEPVLNRVAGVPFHNISKLDFDKLIADPNHIASNLTAYIKGFSEAVREIFLERFDLTTQIAKLDEADLLFQVVKQFAAVDLHPNSVSNHDMGLVYEELIRKFAELSNETAGEHFTPREVIRLMVDLLFVEDNDVLSQPGIVRTLFDPACGTGGMLSVAAEYVRELNPQADLQVFGQELNDESFAICKSDMMIKGENPENITRGNSFSKDGHAGATFDYMLSNPPFGVEWKQVQKVVEDEHTNLGFSGRFGPGTPRISDGSLLFLLHMCSKMKQSGGGSRLAIVFNGSPLFTGDAGSGESEIRRWLLENDLLEAIIGLPDQLFYNTGISTYVWIVNNRKPKPRKGKVQLIDATAMFQKTRKSLGEKRKEIGEGDRATIVGLYHAFEENERSKIFRNAAFGYQKIVVERPLRLKFQVTAERIAALQEEKAFQAVASSKKKGAAGQQDVAEREWTQAAILEVLRGFNGERVFLSRDEFSDELATAMKRAEVKLAAPVGKAILSVMSERDEAVEPCVDRGGTVEPDSDLRDNENVPLGESIEAYMAREVLPHVPDAWVDLDKTRAGYEIPFTRHFYKYTPLRPLAVIEAEIRGLEDEIRGMLDEVIDGN